MDKLAIAVFIVIQITNMFYSHILGTHGCQVQLVPMINIIIKIFKDTYHLSILINFL